MATPRKQNLNRDLKRLSSITSRQLASLERLQKNGGGLDSEAVSQLKRLSDSLDDQIKLRRMLDQDTAKMAADTPQAALDLIADLQSQVAYYKNRYPEDPGASGNPNKISTKIPEVIPE